MAPSNAAVARLLLCLTLLIPGAAMAKASVVRFACGQDICEGTLYRPDGAARPPVVVMGHGFAGTRDVGLPFFARRFAAGGIAAFAFDYRHFGTSGGRPRQYVDPQQQIADFASAAAVMRRRGDLDGARLAFWGSSMGAGNALIAAAADGHVQALVVQAPLIDTAMDGEATRPTMGFAIKIVLSGWRDMLSRAVGGAGYPIPAIAHSGGFGMIADDAAYAAFERLVTPGMTYRNAVLASSAFNFKHYNPITDAPRLAMPVLIVASPKDRFAPFAGARELKAKVASAHLAAFEGDHFDIYSLPAAPKVAALETDFLLGALRARP